MAANYNSRKDSCIECMQHSPKIEGSFLIICPNTRYFLDFFFLDAVHQSAMPPSINTTPSSIDRRKLAVCACTNWILNEHFLAWYKTFKNNNMNLHMDLHMNLPMNLHNIISRTIQNL